MNESRPIDVAEEVQVALAAGAPVVALESTIISHGLPRPRNLEVAGELENIIRDAGVVPATIGVVAGRALVGLDAEQLEFLAGPQNVIKAGVRDLAPALAAGLHAATTVAATAMLAHKAGIRVLATGGIGGVHRGAAESFDESADLTVLARTPVTVVCAGAKSILDIGATLERLETLGVSVVGYGTTRFPGFFVSDSGFPLTSAVQRKPTQVVSIMQAADLLGLESAIVLANPVPAEHQLDPTLHDSLLEEALAAVEAAGVRGKAVTPYLLDHLNTRSAGATLEANVWAVRSNVSVAADIAKAWSERGPWAPGNRAPA